MTIVVFVFGVQHRQYWDRCLKPWTNSTVSLEKTRETSNFSNTLGFEACYLNKTNFRTKTKSIERA